MPAQPEPSGPRGAAGSAPVSLTRFDVASGSPTGLVLLLHGGKPSSGQAVDGRSASWRRMAAIQRAVTPAAHEQGVSTWLLRYGVRGWNHGAPVRDARRALEEVRAELGEVPVVLLGHSMGARVAVHVADDPAVVGVVGLAPWWEPDDPVHGVRGKRVAAAHGRTDKITSARRTRAYLERAEALASSVEFVDMGRVGHYMLRHVEAWNEVARSRSLDLLA